MTQKIVAVGDLTFDLIMPIKFPIEVNLSIEVPWHGAEPGGSANFLIMGQRLGGQMRVVGTLGDDMYGREGTHILSEEGVETAGIIVQPGSRTTVVLVLMEPDTGRFTYVWHGGKGQTVEIGIEGKRVIDSADALFLQGYTLCETHLTSLVDYVLNSDRILWFDVGPAIAMVPQNRRTRVLQRAHYVLSTEHELSEITEGLTGQAAYDYLFNAGTRMLVIKRGAEGCRVVTQDSQFDVPAFPVMERDLVGAGDAFNAAFIYATLLGMAPRQAAILANATGGAKVQKLSTGRNMPTRAEIETVLKDNKIILNF